MQLDTAADLLADGNEPNNSAATATGIGVGVTTGALCTTQASLPTDRDFYTVTVPSGKQLDVTLTNLPADYNVYVQRDGVTLAERWADGASTLYGMMVRGFPNLFAMPAPGQQAVVTVNYTQLAVLGAEVIGRTIAELAGRGVGRAEVTAEAEAAWTEAIVSSFVDGSMVMAACTPSRINNEGHPELLNPRNGNYGRGFGDWFAYRDLLHGWLDAGELAGLELS